MIEVPDGSLFTVECLPYCVFARPGGPARVGVGIGDHVLDLAVALDDAVFAEPTLNGFMAQGPARWRSVRDRITGLLTSPRAADEVRAALVAQADITLRLPIAVGDYVDGYASLHHATNVGRMFRPDAPLHANWRHLPVAYHGRAGTVVVSGTPVVRPNGQILTGERPVLGPSARLDFEAEVGFVVGAPNRPGAPIPVDDVAAHVFGVVLVNDWSARDIQRWEYVPLGPFLGKSFATSISPWVVPLAALDAARVAPPTQDPAPLPYLRPRDGWGLDLQLEVAVNGTVVTRPPFAQMYWTAAQQLAHMTVNGASVRTGDLFASGTVSGAERSQCGSLLELSWNGTRPVSLADDATRTFLDDGDRVTITATAPGSDGRRIGLGAVTGAVAPARAVP